jgi:transposase InsO family protein
MPAPLRGRRTRLLLWLTALTSLFLMNAAVVGAMPGGVCTPSGLVLGTGSATLAGLARSAAFNPPALMPASVSAAAALQEFVATDEPSIMPNTSTFEKHPDHLWSICKRDDMSPEQRARAETMLTNHRQCFAHNTKELPGYSGPVEPFRVHVDMARAEGVKPSKRVPIYQSPRRYSDLENAIINEKMPKLEAADMIEDCLGGDFAARLVLPLKRDAVTGLFTDRRVTTDLRGINAVTTPDHYALPIGEEQMRSVQGCEYVSKCDFLAGYFQCVVDPRDRPKLAFWWHNRLMQWKRMPMGAKNSGAYFQRTVERVLRDAGLSDVACAFVDDVLIKTKTYEQHVVAVAAVLTAFHDAGLRVHPDKSYFFARTVEFLGVNISADGLQISAAKLTAISAMQPPRNVHELRSVLGTLNFVRGFAPNFSTMAAPLHALLKAKAAWRWGAGEQTAFDAIKAALAKCITLSHPDPKLPFTLYTDYSNKGLGALLCQTDAQGVEHLCVAISRSCNTAECSYSSWDGEMLAVCWACKTLRPYILARPVTVQCDHMPLLYLLNATDLHGKHARWVMGLQDYDLTIVHRPGATQPADYLSRSPHPSTADVSGARIDHDILALPPSAKALTNTSLANASRDMRDARANCLVMHAVMGERSLAHELATPDLSLAGNNGYLTDTCDTPPNTPSSLATERTRQLRTTALNSSAAAASLAAAPPRGWVGDGRVTSLGVEGTIALGTSLVGPAFFSAAATEGVVLWDMCGGVCGGLEAALRVGVKIKRYLYSDTNTTAQRVAVHRMHQLHMAYPSLLPDHAIADSLTALPMDISSITPTDLVRAGATAPEQWLALCGWPCQDLSAAGAQRGLSGSRSGLFYPMLHVLGALQQIQPLPPAYLLENVAVEGIGLPADAAAMRAAVGPHITFDAAQFGSHAHRLRSYWTNLADANHVVISLSHVQRNVSGGVTSILDSPRVAPRVQVPDSYPYYSCNVVGQPMQAVPTLMATQGSWRHRDGGPGMIWDPNLMGRAGAWAELNPDERERAMGYDTGITNATGVTLSQRHTLMGNALDANAVSGLMALSWALNARQCTPAQPPPCSRRVRLGGGSGVVSLHATAAPEEPPIPIEEMTLAEAAEAIDTPLGRRDVYDDDNLFSFLVNGTLPDGLPEAERRRVQKRAKLYAWDGQSLWRIMPDGARRVCPAPALRPALVQQVHATQGHYGERRTTSLLAHTHWWYGIAADVAAVCQKCTECARRNVVFSAAPPQLNSLPIMGLFYRWGCDLFGPLPVTSTGSTYVFLATEYFSKTVVGVALPNKEAATTAAAYRDRVLCIYGAPAEMITDQGTEWRDQFSSLLAESFVDHRTTSAYHPQANGLTERAVQTIKRALAKMAYTAPANWDEHLPYVILGYNASVQKSTGFSPYHLLYAVPPSLPNMARPVFDSPLDFDDPVLAAQSVYARGLALQHDMVIAGSNLSIAQHRDQLRYATTRAGAYTRQLEQLTPGSYVYLKVHDPVSLDLRAHPDILRVREVKDSGILILEGRCGTPISVHVSAVTPCHVPVLDGAIYLSLAQTVEGACQVCNRVDSEETLLICNGCGTLWHLRCLTPPLLAVPSAPVWLCPGCTLSGVKESDVQANEAAAPTILPSDPIIRRPAGPHLQHEGRVILREFLTGIFEGRIAYDGHQGSNALYRIHYDDPDDPDEVVTGRKLAALWKEHDRLAADRTRRSGEGVRPVVPAPAAVGPVLRARSQATVSVVQQRSHQDWRVSQ